MLILLALKLMIPKALVSTQRPSTSNFHQVKCCLYFPGRQQEEAQFHRRHPAGSRSVGLRVE